MDVAMESSVGSTELERLANVNKPMADSISEASLHSPGQMILALRLYFCAILFGTRLSLGCSETSKTSR